MPSSTRFDYDTVEDRTQEFRLLLPLVQSPVVRTQIALRSPASTTTAKRYDAAGTQMPSTWNLEHHRVAEVIPRRQTNAPMSRRLRWHTVRCIFNVTESQSFERLDSNMESFRKAGAAVADGASKSR